MESRRWQLDLGVSSVESEGPDADNDVEVPGVEFGGPDSDKLRNPDADNPILYTRSAESSEWRNRISSIDREEPLSWPSPSELAGSKLQDFFGTINSQKFQKF